MNEPVRKSLRVEGLENRRPSILICATCVCVHRSTMIFVVLVLFCFVFALKIFLQRCKKELLQQGKKVFLQQYKKVFLRRGKKVFLQRYKKVFLQRCKKVFLIWCKITFTCKSYACALVCNDGDDNVDEYVVVIMMIMIKIQVKNRSKSLIIESDASRVRP